MIKNHPVIWALKDDRPGDYNQVFGVAEALGSPYEIKEIKFTKYVRLTNLIRGSSLLGIDMEQSTKMEAPWPDIILGAGRKTAPLSRYIKKQSGGKTKLVQMMWPGFPVSDFDMIVTPKHDALISSKRIFNSVGAPNRVTPEMLRQHAEKWRDKFAHLPKLKIALLVGGNTKGGKFTDKHAKDLVDKVSQFVEGKDVGLLITNSRRTSESATNFLKNGIKTPYYFHDSKSGNENPFFGYLALSDVIIVSGDSISMCSEACSTGKPVYIYAPANITPRKHKQFHQSLYEKGYAKPLTNKWLEYNYFPLNDAKLVAEAIRKNYF
ncbi:MAG: putative nucleoside-diphosphate-sugar epimerase [Rickettsiaceae bacterium]|nr:putative nucleoside-diphosphate-sugar epimerase [Rickettsiaceae bacterium]